MQAGCAGWGEVFRAVHEEGMVVPAPLSPQLVARGTPAGATDADAREGRGNGFESHVSLSLLGGFALTIGGAPISLPVPAQRVLAFVALQERPVRRTHAAEVLWLESPQGRARASLRSALWALRRCGNELVDVTNQCLRLGEVVVDARVLADWAHAVLEGEPTYGPRSRFDGLDEGLPGDLLPDWYDDWLVVERERLRELRARALERICERLTAAGSFRQAAEAGLAALDADPLRESTHRCLVGLHLAEGNQADALHSYFLYRDLLHKRLGLEPSARMEELVRGLRA